jgi:hypothetical protein
MEPTQVADIVAWLGEPSAAAGQVLATHFAADHHTLEAAVRYRTPVAVGGMQT